MKQPNDALVTYVEERIIPRYETFDRAHGTDHVRTVIARSLDLARRYGADIDMAYAIAAYHDTGLCEGRERHHIVSGELLAADPVLARYFLPEQLRIMREAVEDHRASNEHAPRSLYGRIVAEADRCIDAQVILRRTVQYGLAHNPELDREGQYARCVEHLERKYAEDGYLRLWLEDSDNAVRLAELRRVIRDRERLRGEFDRIYDEETARSDSDR